MALFNQLSKRLRFTCKQKSFKTVFIKNLQKLTYKIFFRNKRTTVPFCLSFFLSAEGADIGEIRIKALFFDNKGQQRSGKLLDTIQGKQGKLCTSSQPGCAKGSNWSQKYYEIPIWENRVRIKFEIEHQAIGVRGSYGDIAIDDMIIDEGKCVQSVCLHYMFIHTLL